MKSSAHLALLLSLLIHGYFCLANAALTESKVVAGLQWGSMKTHTKTKGHVFHLEEDVFVVGNILYTDQDTLMTTDGKTNHMIVGSGYGSIEGRLGRAKFLQTTGFLQVNSSHVLLVDRGNHCLFYISRVSNNTSPFVGNCSSPGYEDGQYEKSRFFSPWSVIKDLNNLRAGIVTDGGKYGSLRHIDLDKGHVKTLTASIPPYPLYAAFDSDKDNIYITFPHFLGQLNVKTLNFIPFLDGGFNLGNRGIVLLNKLCLVAGGASHKLRILDANKVMIQSICTGAEELVDGTTTSCSLREPMGLLLGSDTLYIGEKGSIRRIPVRTVFKCENKNMHLSTGDKNRCREENCLVNNGITADACQEKMCLNSEICTTGANKTCFCTCRDGWKGTNCNDVSDSNMITRLDISANYKLQCHLLDDFKELTLSIAKRRYSQINQLSSGLCSQPKDGNIMLSCASDLLKVIWPTDCIFQGNSTTQQERTQDIILGSLQRTKGLLLDLLIPSHMPSIIQPKFDQQGLAASVIMTKICSSGLRYMKNTATCQ